MIRDWLLRFNAERPAGLIDGKAPKLSASQRQALVQRVESGAIPAVHEVVRWRLKDLTRWLFEEFGISDVSSPPRSAFSRRPASRLNGVSKISVASPAGPTVIGLMAL